MKTNHDMRFTKEYPHGVFCKCGVTIHLKDEELTPPCTIVVCPRCGYEIAYMCGASEPTVSKKKWKDEVKELRLKIYQSLINESLGECTKEKCLKDIKDALFKFDRNTMEIFNR